MKALLNDGNDKK